METAVVSEAARSLIAFSGLRQSQASAIHFWQHTSIMQASPTRAIVRQTAKALRHGSRTTSRALATATDKSIEPTQFDKVTQLPNGIRVATEALPGAFAGVGVYLDAGSRYENDSLRGVSHIVDRLAFKSTSKRNSDEMLETLESLGGNIHCASSRETLMYQAATFNGSVPTTMGVLAETIRDPLITEKEVEQQLETAEYEIGEIWSKPELILPELVHLAAYKDNTLGNPLLCPQERLPYINKQVIEKYRSEFYKPERIVIAFAGVDHGEALELSEKWFGDMKTPTLSQTGSDTTFNTQPPSIDHPASYQAAGPTQKSSKLLDKIPFIKNLSTSATSQASVAHQPLTSSGLIDFSAPSRYTGGFLSLPAIPPPLNPALPRLSHIHVAFEAVPISSPDIYALATLQTLLGGGGSFSAGGPGKGMYSRLYTNVLNQHGWVESCVSFNHSYTDSGLFGISASCDPRYVSHMLDVICRELQSLSLETGFSALKAAEVQRAKNQLKSSLLMNLESRMVELEDLGRQVQVHGRKIGVKEMCAKIDALTIEDLRRVARTVVTGQVNNDGQGTGAPTVVLQEGDDEGLDRKDFAWSEIQDRIARWKLGRR